DRRSRILKGREEPVAGLLDHLSAAREDSLAHELVVPSEQLSPLLVAERLEQLRRVDDVGEKKRAVRLDPAEELLDALLVELCSESLEGRKRCLELCDCTVLVPLLLERDRE